jgi:hypothetical protein
MTKQHALTLPQPKFDLTGMRFGRLVVLGATGERGHRGWVWRCLCDCGNESLVITTKLRRGTTRSCGCGRGFHGPVSEEQRTHLREIHTVHGRHGTPIYHKWGSMRARCENPQNRGYKDYGGRGIRVCERWQTFENFYADMGDPPPGMSLERINNDGDYEPSNCRWATMSQQNRNKRGNRLLTDEGRTQCLTAWAEEVGICVPTLHCRLSHGWSVHRALRTPLRGKADRT